MSDRPHAPLLLLALSFSLAASPAGAAAGAKDEYRLIHAIGNDEREIARGLSKQECEARKKEHKAVASILGTYDEATGYGSITCLPESLFKQ